MIRGGYGREGCPTLLRPTDVRCPEQKWSLGNILGVPSPLGAVASRYLRVVAR